MADALLAGLWRAACKLRGQLDAAEYKHVLSSLLFLRFASLDDFSSLDVPESARFENLSASPTALDRALVAVERANPELKDALPRCFRKSGLGASRLKELLALFADLDSRERDALGRAHEFLLERFARAEGRRGGEFFTPAGVVRLLGAMLGPVRGTLYDPCCGAGGMFLEAGREAREVYGQERNPSTWRLARRNLALHGRRADLGRGPADSLRDDLHAGRVADVVLANPPFNQSDWGADALSGDPRFACGVPSDTCANLAWVQHVLSHVAEGGRAAVVLSNTSLSATRGGEPRIRRALLERGVLECIVALPARLFFTTQIPACVWILSRAPRGRAGRVLFIDARGTGRLLDRTHAALEAGVQQAIAAAYRSFREGNGDGDRPGFSRSADHAEIAAQSFSLAPGRYVRARPKRDERGFLRRRLNELAAAWDAQERESRRLSEEVRRALRELEVDAPG